jgi:putative redox protein
MGTIRASAQQLEKLRHDVKVRSHVITADEPASHGGDDSGPNPQELLAAALASCVAITMEMYARRKGWNIAGLRVDCEYAPAERGHPTQFRLVTKMPAHLTDEQIDRLAVIGAKCPVHRTLEGEVSFDEQVELA